MKPRLLFLLLLGAGLGEANFISILEGENLNCLAMNRLHCRLTSFTLMTLS